MRLQQLVRGAVAGDEEALDIFNIGNKEIFDFCADFRQGSLANLAPRRHWTLEQISCKLRKKSILMMRQQQESQESVGEAKKEYL